MEDHFKKTAFVMALLFSFSAVFSEAQGQPAPQNDKEKKALVSRKSEEKAEMKDILLVAGLQTVMDLEFKPCEPYDQCIKVINSQLVTIQYVPDKQQIIFTPIKNGETTVSVRDESGDLRLVIKTIVSSSNLARALREIRDLLKDIEGINFRILGNKIVADGEVIVPSDLNRVLAVLGDGAYKDIVLNLVTVSPIGHKILAKRIQDEVNNPKVTVRVLNGTFILEGIVDRDQDRVRAEEILKNLLPPRIEFALESEKVQLRRIKPQAFINLIRVAAKKQTPPPKLVRMTINFVELAKGYNRYFGFSWQPGLDNGGTFAFGPSTTGGVTSQSNGAISGVVSNLFPKLATAQVAGYVRVLQETTLVTQSNVQGHVKRGQKLPVLVLDRNGNQTFQAFETGLDLKMTPNVNGDSVGLKVSFSFNNIVGRTGGVGGQPTIAQNLYEGTLSLKSSESAAIVNLVTNNIVTDFNKDSPNTQAPANPLFSLVRSKAFQKDKSQFVIFVTPQVMESASTGTEDIKKKFGMKRK